VASIGQKLEQLRYETAVSDGWLHPHLLGLDGILIEFITMAASTEMMHMFDDSKFS
jgi:hypothetical protein